MHNDHYKQLEIDTIALWKANKTLSQLIDACEFQIDKYNRRPKEGEETKDCDKIVYYSNLKKDCYLLAKSVGYDLSYDDAFKSVNKPNMNLCQEILPKYNFSDDLIDSLKYNFINDNNKDLIKKQSEDDIYEVKEGSTFRAILGDKITIVGESTRDDIKFVVAKLSNGTEARLSKNLLETSYFKIIIH